MGNEERTGETAGAVDAPQATPDGSDKAPRPSETSDARGTSDGAREPHTGDRPRPTRLATLVPLIRQERWAMAAVLGALAVLTALLVAVSREGAGNEPLEDNATSGSQTASAAFNDGGVLVDLYADTPPCDELSQTQHEKLGAQHADLNQPSEGNDVHQRKCLWRLPERGLVVELTTKRFVGKDERFGSAGAEAEFTSGGGTPVSSPKIGDAYVDRGCDETGCQLAVRHTNLLVYLIVTNDGQHGTQNVRELAYGLMDDYAEQNLLD